MLAWWRRKYGKDKEFYTLFHDMLGFTPDNIELYKLALIHRSASVHLADGGVVNNERLEFLGDAVLESVVSDFLFIEYPDEPEGFLTRMRSRLVSRTSMNELAKQLGLDKHVIANPGGSFIQKHLHGNAFEAVIGAIYLDKGYNFANRLLINDIFKKYVNLNDMSHTETDHKSRLIEWCQKSRRSIRFHTVVSKDSDPHSPVFISQLYIDSMKIGRGEGLSKKEAEQNAAELAMNIMNDEIGDHILDKIDSLQHKHQ